jgi:allantoicase
MSDGWETKRRRGPGNDWVVIKLARAGQIQRLEVDTSHFKGNYPESCSLEVANLNETMPAESTEWKAVLPRTKLQAHTRHYFAKELGDSGVATHVRFNIFPDGGVSRLRVFGRLTD